MSSVDGGIEWEAITEFKTLRIGPAMSPQSGFQAGQMKDYNAEVTPWDDIVTGAGAGWQIVLNDGVLNIGKNTFQFGTYYTGALDIPSSVKTIDNNAFQGCKNLTSLALHEGLVKINSGAFNGCSGIKGSLVIPSTVTDLGDSAFNGCSGFTGDLVIPDKITKIGSEAFHGCSGFDGNIKIGAKVQQIGAYAFANCSSLKGDLELQNGIDFQRYVFLDCPNIDAVVFNGSKSTVMEGAFCLDATASAKVHDCYSIGNWAEGSLVGQIVKDTKFSFHTLWPNIDGGIGWKKDNTGKILTIGVSDKTEEGYSPGQMKDYESIGPWGQITDSGWKLVIEEGVTNIGTHAFEKCTGLTEALLSKGLTTVGEGAFTGCSSIGSFTLPKAINSIGKSAFNGCYNVKSFTFLGSKPTTFSLVSMRLGTSSHPTECDCYSPGNWAENVIPARTDQYTTWHYYSSAKVSGGIEWEKDEDTKVLTIKPTDTPEEGYTSGQMKRYALDDRPWGTITETGWKIVIEKGVTNIGVNAFSGNTGFVGDLKIPDGVTTIDDYAFNNCTGIDGEVYIPGSVTTMGTYALQGHKMSKLVLNEGLKSIGQTAIGYCESLTEITIPSTVETILDHAFYRCKSVKNVTLLGHPTNIGDSAFALGYSSGYADTTCYSENNWAESVLPSKSSSYTRWTFKSLNTDGGIKWTKNTETKTLTIAPSDDPEEGYQTGQMRDYDPYHGSPAPWGEITEEGWALVIEEGVTVIGKNAFHECYGFVGVLTVPATVTEIREGAFMGCSSVSTLDLKCLQPILNDAYYAFALNMESFERTYRCFSPDNWAKGIVDIEGLCGPSTKWKFGYVDGGIEWERNDTTKTLTIRPTAEPEEGYVRGQMPSYPQEDSGPWGQFKESGWKLVLADGVIEIGDHAFLGSSGFTGTLTLPNGLTKIGDMAFQDCGGFTGQLKFPESVTYIGVSAFGDVSNVSNVVFMGKQPELKLRSMDLCSIPSKTYPCYSPNNWAEGVIDTEKVSRFTKWRLYELGYNVSGGIVWKKDTATKILTFKPTNYPEIGFKTGVMKDYTGTTPWGSLKIDGWKAVFGDGITHIGAYALFEATGLTSSALTLPKSLESIGEQAFYGCTKLTDIVLPTTVKKIGYKTFIKCTSLKSITLGSVSQLGQYAFMDCKALESITISESTTAIGKGAFQGCSGLMTVIFKSETKVSFINNDSFKLDNGEKVHTCISPNNWAEGVIDKSEVCGLTKWEFKTPTYSRGYAFVNGEFRNGRFYRFVNGQFEEISAAAYVNGGWVS